MIGSTADVDGLATALQFLLWPAAFHGLLVVLSAGEADSPAEIWVFVALASFAVGLSCDRFVRWRLPLAAAAGAWPPVVGVALKLYWSVGAYSPGGPSQTLVALLGWDGADPALATAVCCGAAAALGWALSRGDRWTKRRLGWSLFDAFDELED